MRNNARSRWNTLILFALVIAVGVLVGGCGKDKDEVKYHNREGRVATINPETGVFEGLFYSKKHKQEIKLSGRLDPNVEVFINGATAKVSDVRVDDKVVVEVREVKHGSEREFIATKVEVTRPFEESAPAPK